MFFSKMCNNPQIYFAEICTFPQMFEVSLWQKSNAIATFVQPHCPILFLYQLFLYNYWIWNIFGNSCNLLCHFCVFLEWGRSLYDHLCTIG